MRRLAEGLAAAERELAGLTGGLVVTCPTVPAFCLAGSVGRAATD